MLTAVRWVRRRLAALRSSEAGASLAELLVAITILGIAIPAIIASLATASTASSQHRKHATADTVLKSYGEAIKDTIRRVPSTYVDCPATSPTTYSTPLDWSVPTGYTVEVSEVKYLTPTGWGSCNTGPAYVGTQLLLLRATSTSTALQGPTAPAETLEIVLRKP